MTTPITKTSEKEELLVLTIEATGLLRHMVRDIVRTLVEVGCGCTQFAIFCRTARIAGSYQSRSHGAAARFVFGGSEVLGAGHYSPKTFFLRMSILILLRDRLLSEKVPFESHWYNAGHSFFNEMGPNYDDARAQQAWERPTEFFAKRLK